MKKQKTEKERYKEIEAEFLRYQEDGTDNNEKAFIQRIWNIIRDK